MLCDLLIFDCDGVLVDSEPIVNRVFVEMLAEEGFQLALEDTLHQFAGSSMENRLQVTEQRLGWSAPANFVGSFYERLGRALRKQLCPVPGVTDVLAEARHPRCVASNGTHPDIRLRLGLAGLLQHFEPHLFSASDVARPKPDPDLFLHAAERMGVAPARCVVVEDSVAGVQAGVRAGMRVLGYAGLTNGRLLRDAGAMVFDRMSELPALVPPLGDGGRKTWTRS